MIFVVLVTSTFQNFDQDYFANIFKHAVLFSVGFVCNMLLYSVSYEAAKRKEKLAEITSDLSAAEDTKRPCIPPSRFIGQESPEKHVSKVCPKLPSFPEESSTSTSGTQMIRCYTISLLFPMRPEIHFGLFLPCSAA